MFTLHGSKKLLSKLKVSPEERSAPTTKLGNWYATSVTDGPRSPIVCVSERTLLPVVVKACSAKNFLAEFTDALRALLLEVGIAPAEVDAECAEMTTLTWAKSTDRSVIGVLNEHVGMAEAMRFPLAENIVKLSHPIDETRALFGITKADTLELVVLSAGSLGLRVRRLDDDAVIRFITPDYDQVPGEIITVQPEHQKLAGAQTLKGSVSSHRLDVSKLGLKPFEFEDTNSPDVATSTALREAGRSIEARDLLHALLQEDLRCLDAHAQLGDSYFTNDPLRASRHYAVGVAIGELSLGENSAFLRCLRGWGLCQWRLEQREQAVSAFTRLLRLDPDDILGARVLLEKNRGPQAVVRRPLTREPRSTQRSGKNRPNELSLLLASCTPTPLAPTIRIWPPDTAAPLKMSMPSEPNGNT